MRSALVMAASPGHRSQALSPVVPAMINEIRTGSRYFRAAEENRSLTHEQIRDDLAEFRFIAIFGRVWIPTGMASFNHTTRDGGLFEGGLHLLSSS